MRHPAPYACSHPQHHHLHDRRVPTSPLHHGTSHVSAPTAFRRPTQPPATSRLPNPNPVSMPPPLTLGRPTQPPATWPIPTPHAHRLFRVPPHTCFAAACRALTDATRSFCTSIFLRSISSACFLGPAVSLSCAGTGENRGWRGPKAWTDVSRVESGGRTGSRGHKQRGRSASAAARQVGVNVQSYWLGFPAAARRLMLLLPNVKTKSSWQAAPH